MIIILLMIVILVLPGGKAAGKIPQEEYLKSLKEGNDLLSKKEVDKKNILAEGFNEYDIEFSANNQVTSYMMDGELHYITSADHSVSMGTGIRNIVVDSCSCLNMTIKRRCMHQGQRIAPCLNRL